MFLQSIHISLCDCVFRVWWLKILFSMIINAQYLQNTLLKLNANKKTVKSSAVSMLLQTHKNKIQKKKRKENKKRQTIDIKYCVAFVTVLFFPPYFRNALHLGSFFFYKWWLKQMFKTCCFVLCVFFSFRADFI